MVRTCFEALEYNTSSSMIDELRCLIEHASEKMYAKSKFLFAEEKITQHISILAWSFAEEKYHFH